jgi:GH25 family lysozyme M1 (1,4-beta-N-acetylmuramidase)
MIFPDLSNWQKGSNVAAILSALDSDRVWLKASEGHNIQSSTFIPWAVFAANSGKKVGAYHFARPSQSQGNVEAAWHAAVLKMSPLTPTTPSRYWTTYDMEDPNLDRKSSSDSYKARTHAASFAQTMASLGWTRGVIYGSAPYIAWAQLVPTDLPEGWRYLHIANYDGVSDTMVPLPPVWTRDQVVARQYTSAAQVSGATTEIDLNRVVNDWLTNGGTVSAQDVNDALNTGLADGFTTWQQQMSRKPDGIVWLLRSMYNQLGLSGDTPQGVVASNQQVGLVGAAVGAARADIATILAAVQGLASGSVSIDYDILADRVVDRLAARLVAGAPPLMPAPDQQLNPWAESTPMADAAAYGLTEEDEPPTTAILLPQMPTTPPPGESTDGD